MSELPHLLIVDNSKVVRASLAKNLQAHFQIREEKCGETAWQTLILDSQIIAVVSGVGLAKLDGLGLLERTRANRLCRLKTLPFFLIESDAMGPAARQQALDSGVSGFIAKGLGMTETARVINNLMVQWRREHPVDCAAVCGASERCAQARYMEASITSCQQDDLGISDVFGPIRQVSEISATALPGRPVARPSDELQEVPRTAIVERLDQLFAAPGGGRGLGVLLFGMDGYSKLLKRFGHSLADRIDLKFGQLLSSKLRAGDSIAKVAGGSIVIVATETTVALCSAFAERVGKGVAAAQVAVGGRRIDMTVSVGIACCPEDDVEPAGEALLAMAERRLEAAKQAGGNRVFGGVSPGAMSGGGELFLQRLEEVLAGFEPQSLNVEQSTQAALLVLPLLHALEKAQRLGLPVAELERRLQASLHEAVAPQV
jgi:diguanylate cyclase (GGDEF)-like protein